MDDHEPSDSDDQHAVIVLSERDSVAFADALINPPAQSQRLKRAFEAWKARGEHD